MKDNIKNLKAYVPEEPLDVLMERYGLDRVVRLSANENPFGTSPKVRDTITNSFLESNRYPDGSAEKLRETVSNFYQVAQEQLVFGVGLDEIISLINRTFLTDGDEVLLNAPTFSEYALNAEIEEAVPVYVPVKSDGHIDFDALKQAINDKTKLIWICNPNNPTGTYEDLAAITEFVKTVPEDVLVVIDEAYLEFVTDETDNSAMHLVNDYENLVVLRTFSKVYGLANFRVGFGVFSPKLANYMQTVRLPYNLNSMSQQVAVTALQDQDFVKKTVQKTKEERELWEDWLRENKIIFYHSQANFVFIQLDNANKVAEYLKTKGFLVRNGLQPGWLRITIGNTEDNLQIRDLILEAQ
ncbi:histidinol-phosphate transaminase [Paucilactobacillus nenjiangensis]|uniref:histidinol-phosphate transaminase n=1 Tax=Paucilactobacillus nenjiangensis TaxID=1296540 RepID=UPI0028D2D4FA|nr:histidinol-phosphate transaminase [Paucilactobacillus nenjiangensis]